MSKSLSLVWLRRDLRLHDHAPLAHALAEEGQVQPLFIFDTDILARFPGPSDRRLVFLAETLCDLDRMLRLRGSGLLVFHGKAEILIPKIAEITGASQVFAGEDCEPGARARDKTVESAVRLKLVFDHLIHTPRDILRDGKPYRVFTPYAKAARARLSETGIATYEIRDNGRYAAFGTLEGQLRNSGLMPLSAADGAKPLLDAMGYRYANDALWKQGEGQARLADFRRQGLAGYKNRRDLLAEPGTSRLSPYLRFGLVSVRECAEAALAQGIDDCWLNELLWRDFYAMILYHYPESVDLEYQERFRGVLSWSNHREWFLAWQDGQTGYPVVDAAMRQLKEEGWMHNRGRMIVASFLTKHLRIDWRWGEEHFAQWLMDYDQASNVGGWQWAASTGTDAQPWFRIFNPTLQGKKFDPGGDYVRRYIPELAKLPDAAIHEPWKSGSPVGYTHPIVVHETARRHALEMFESVPS